MIPAAVIIQRHKSPVIDHQEIVFGQVDQHLSVAAVAPGHGQLLKQPGHPAVQGPVTFAASILPLPRNRRRWLLVDIVSIRSASRQAFSQMLLQIILENLLSLNPLCIAISILPLTTWQRGSTVYKSQSALHRGKHSPIERADDVQRLVEAAGC